MPRFHVPLDLQPGAELSLPPAVARHVQVLRLQPGDGLTLFNGQGGEWQAEVLRMGRSEVVVTVVGAHEPVERELPVAVTLAVGMPANDRMDWLVEKATELGVATLQPLQCERSVLRLSGDRAVRKVEHWQGVAVAAAEQSGRTRVPRVAPVRTLRDWLAAAPAPDAARLVLSPAAAGLPPRAALAARVCCLSGPEGGLTPAEEAQAVAAGFIPAGLGPRILRAETAPLAVLAWLALSG